MLHPYNSEKIRDSKTNSLYSPTFPRDLTIPILPIPIHLVLAVLVLVPAVLLNRFGKGKGQVRLGFWVPILFTIERVKYGIVRARLRFSRVLYNSLNSMMFVLYNSGKQDKTEIRR